MGRPLLVPPALRDLLMKSAAQLSLFDESRVERHPAGSGKGGQFAPKGGGQSGGSKRSRRAASRQATNPGEEQASRARVAEEGARGTADGILTGLRAMYEGDLSYNNGGHWWLEAIARDHFDGDEEAALATLREMENEGIVQDVHDGRAWGLTQAGLDEADMVANMGGGEGVSGDASGKKASFEEMLADAVAWDWLRYSASEGRSPEEQMALLQLTNGDQWDKWLMDRFGLDRREARDIANAARTAGPTARNWLSRNKTFLGDMEEPTFDDYPDLKEAWLGGEEAPAEETSPAAAERSGPDPEKPWEWSPVEYQEQVLDVQQPWIGEISPMQFQYLPNNQKRAYQAKRADEWQASADAKQSWKDEVVGAYRAGEIDPDTAGLSDAARSLLSRTIDTDDKEQAVAENQIDSIEEVKPGDMVWHIAIGGPLEVVAVNRKSLRLRDTRERPEPAKESRLARLNARPKDAEMRLDFGPGVFTRRNRREVDEEHENLTKSSRPRLLLAVRRGGGRGE